MRQAKIMNQALTKLDLDYFEKVLVKEDQVSCPVIHRFSPGVYIREVSIPADTLSIGHRQKTEHLNIFLKGRVLMLNGDGSTTELVAPMIFTGQPGRKCGYIKEDVVWLNVYPTDETDVEKLEATYLDKTPVVESETKHIIRAIDSQDYRRVLVEFGFDEETARSQSENKDDRTDFPYGGYKVSVGPSDIEGRGLFATADIEAGEEICIARIDGKRTPAGVYTNHSIAPNAAMVEIDDTIYLIATKKINGYLGGFIGEEITIDYRQSLSIQLGE